MCVVFLLVYKIKNTHEPANCEIGSVLYVSVCVLKCVFFSVQAISIGNQHHQRETCNTNLYGDVYRRAQRNTTKATTTKAKLFWRYIRTRTAYTIAMYEYIPLITRTHHT